MILSFGDRPTERFHAGQRIKAYEGFAYAARLKLDRLDSATELADLTTIPGNRFERLKGTRAGQFSIRINDQWRICFIWDEERHGPADVEIVDYH